MQKLKLLLIQKESKLGAEALLSEKGYDVATVTTPEDAIMSALEIDPEAVIWPEEFSGLSQWDRVKKVLESRKPLIPVSKKVWDNAVDIPSNEDVHRASFESIDLEQTMTSTSELLECLEDFQNRKNSADVHFYTKVGNKLKRIELKNIRYIQVEGKYSAIQLESRQYHVKASLKDLLNVLASPDFVRVSRNYVVNLEHINHIDVYQSTVHIGGEDIPVSRTYKENLMRNVRLL
tara:strand:+ start:169 stop:870 length:702 start_codon:yes stop_codon:yes gene_type:complete